MSTERTGSTPIGSSPEPSSEAPPDPEGGASARRRRRWPWVLALLVGLFVFDVARPPEQQLSARLLVAAIGGYQATGSRLMPALGVQCRFEPTCSHYGRESIRRYGTLEGVARTARRLARCGPWTPMGTVDPP